MRILIAPDSFKGSLSAKEVADSLEKGLMKYNASLSIEKLPLGDGGEGTLDTLISNKIYTGEKWSFDDPYVGQCSVVVGVAENKTYLESASVLGLPWFHDNRIPFGNRNSRSLGILLKQACEKGYRKCQIGLGGTGCHDWGLGMAYEMGVEFLNKQGNLIEQPWANPQGIHHFIVPKIEISITALSDIDAPLTGNAGAALEYAKQKGANDLKSLEKIAFHLLEVLNRNTNKDFRGVKGGAAAGGLGFGLAAFFNAEITSGIQTASKNLQLEKHVSQCDLVITGEGKIDTQSFDGKVLSGILSLARKHCKPVVIVCGKAEKQVRSKLNKEVLQLLETNTFAESEQESIQKTGYILQNRLAKILAKNLKDKRK